MLGLTHAELQDFHSALRNPHDIRIDVDLLNLDGRVLGSVSPKVMTGQVLADRHGFGDPQGPQRRLTLSLLDPRNELNLDTDDPDDGTVYYDRLIRVWYLVYGDEIGDWVEVPVFTGPPWKLQRTGDEVYIEADDISVQGWGATWKPKTVPKGTRKITAIRRILSQRVGYDRFRLPERDARLAHPVSLGRRSHPWAVAQRIAESMDLQLYPDGEGVICARRLPGDPMWTFNPGEGGEIVVPVAVSTERGRFANTIELIGRKPKGEKKRVRDVQIANARHLNSPQRLAMNDVPYHKLETIRNDHIRSEAEAERKAKRILRDRMRSTSEQTCSILPWPHITPGDLARFVTSGGEVVRERIDTFTLPLTVEGAEPMHLNWRDKPAAHRRKVRR